jgi:hypothetical protein
MVRWLLAGALAVAVGACAHAMRGRVNAEPTLEVVNEGASAVALHVVLGVSVRGDTAGFALGTVFAGETACFRLLSGGTLQQLSIRSAEGTFHTTTIIPGSQPGWRLELRGDPQMDRLALQPADRACKPRR